MLIHFDGIFFVKIDNASFYDRKRVISIDEPSNPFKAGQKLLFIFTHVSISEKFSVQALNKINYGVTGLS